MKDWEKDFRESFEHEDGMVDELTSDKLIDYIRSLLATEKKALYEFVKEKKELADKSNDQFIPEGNPFDIGRSIAYSSVLKEMESSE